MSFLDQMKPLLLTDLILILVSYSKGQNWTIDVNSHIEATFGSTVTVSCTFTYPPKHHTKHVQVYWKKPEPSKFDTQDQYDKNAFVFHPNKTFVLEKYRGRTKLTGNKTKGDCSLQIQNVTESEPNIYVRVIGMDDQYSFKMNSVEISVSDIPYIPLPTLETSATNMTQTTSTTPNPAIFATVAVLLALIVVAGIVLCVKHKRSKSFTREDSGYYANFSRTSSNQAKREAYCKTQNNEKLPEPKVSDGPVYLKATDEPVYINLEAPPDQMEQSLDHRDSVYANIDYSKSKKSCT